MIAKWQGLLPYREGLLLQNQMWSETLQDGLTRIIGCEHPAVITLGKRSHPELDLKPTNLESILIDRGGQATLHSPGQLVIYPIVHLRQHQIAVRDFVHELLLATQKNLADYGVTSFERPESPGLYTESGKIVFCGLRIERGVSRHGLSINLNNDLVLFDHIRSCGVESAPLDSVQKNLIRNVSTSDFFASWLEHFRLV